jgi:two-component system alkaline phosphatase synthesis response regulator PhoP
MGRPKQKPKPKRILLAEDDANIREISAAALQQSGYRVDTAEDGAAAWDIMQGNRYDLLVTDNSMPKMTGVDLLKRLRVAGIILPVIMATGTLPTYEFSQNPGLQPASTLRKPYTAEELLSAVQEVLRAVMSGREVGMPPPNGQRPPSSNSWGN